MVIHIVRYSGAFAFIKPWTAVRDELTFSQQFLTQSIIEGIRQKLGVSAIIRHRLHYLSISRQMEMVQSRGWTLKQKKFQRKKSIITRGILIHPDLCLAFPSIEDAQRACVQHICLCRNEDILLPVPVSDEAITLSIEEEVFGDPDRFPGFELRFGQFNDSFLTGFNRFDQRTPMYGELLVFGNPLIKPVIE